MGLNGPAKGVGFRLRKEFTRMLGFRLNKLIATNDYLIELILKSDRHRVDADGTCWIIDYSNKKWRRWDKPVGRLKNPYRTVSFKNKNVTVHRLVYARFVGKLNKNLQINHIDGNPSNNKPENLELVTQSENLIHRFRVLKRPAIIGKSKINQEIANEIRARRAAGEKYSSLVKDYNLSKSTISYIVNKRTWNIGV